MEPEQSLLGLFTAAVSDASAEGRAAALASAHRACRDTSARDAEWNAALHAALGGLLPFAWGVASRARTKEEKDAAQTCVCLSNEIVVYVRAFSEVRSAAHGLMIDNK